MESTSPRVQHFSIWWLLPMQQGHRCWLRLRLLLLAMALSKHNPAALSVSERPGWVRQAGGAGFDGFHSSVASPDDDTIYLVGSSTSSAFGAGYAGDETDGIVAHYDSKGTLIRSARLGDGTVTDTFRCVATWKDFLFVVGDTQGDWNTGNQGGFDGLVVKIHRETLAMVESAMISGNDEDSLEACVIANDVLYVGGSTSSDFVTASSSTKDVLAIAFDITLSQPLSTAALWTVQHTGVPEIGSLNALFHITTTSTANVLYALGIRNEKDTLFLLSRADGALLDTLEITNSPASSGFSGVLVDPARSVMYHVVHESSASHFNATIHARPSTGSEAVFATPSWTVPLFQMQDDDAFLVTMHNGHILPPVFLDSDIIAVAGWVMREHSGGTKQQSLLCFFDVKNRRPATLAEGSQDPCFQWGAAISANDDSDSLAVSSKSSTIFVAGATDGSHPGEPNNSGPYQGAVGGPRSSSSDAVLAAWAVRPSPDPFNWLLVLAIVLTVLLVGGAATALFVVGRARQQRAAQQEGDADAVDDSAQAQNPRLPSFAPSELFSVASGITADEAPSSSRRNRPRGKGSKGRGGSQTSKRGGRGGRAGRGGRGGSKKGSDKRQSNLSLHTIDDGRGARVVDAVPMSSMLSSHSGLVSVNSENAPYLTELHDDQPLDP